MRRIWLLAVLCFLCIAGFAHAENRALLVGCDTFLSRPDTSPSSANNVAQMAEALSGGAMNLEVLVTRRYGISGAAELTELIRDTFSGAAEGDVSYFYISTHGLWEPGEPGNSMTLLLSDGKTENGITAQQLHDAFSEVAGTKVLIVDACHAGAMIAKGIRDEYRHIFEGDSFKLICSSGGTEESWFWRGEDGEEMVSGGGYFSDVLSAGISVKTGYGADINRDGVVTLDETGRYLLSMHGASTVHIYPEHDEFPFLSYYAGSVRQQTRPVGNVAFDEGILNRENPSIVFSYTVFQPCRVAYQLVYQTAGRWDFEHAQLVYDTGDGMDTAGYVLPGLKEREITLESAMHGYVLFQILVSDESGVYIAASCPIGIVDRELSEIVISHSGSFDPSRGEEMGFVITHDGPVQMTAVIENGEGEKVVRLLSRACSRPEQLYPQGSTLYWDGKGKDGKVTAPGEYVLRLEIYVNGEKWEFLSDPFALVGEEN